MTKPYMPPSWTEYTIYYWHGDKCTRVTMEKVAPRPRSTEALRTLNQQREEYRRERRPS